MVLEIIIPYITDIVQKIGYPGVFFLMFLESTFIPIPSEAVLPFAGILISQGEFSIVTLTIIAAIASLMGSLTSYIIGYYFGERFLTKFGKYFFLEQEDLNIANNFFRKHGIWAIFTGRFIPVIRHIISVPAGAGKMNPVKFSIATIIGAGIWNFILIYLGIILGDNYNLIKHFSEIFDIIVISLIVIVLIIFIKKRIRSRKNV